MKIKFRIGIGMVSLLLCGATFSEERAVGSADWESLCERQRSVGLDTDRMSEMIGQCRKQGFSTQDTEKLLAPVFAANQEGISTEAVFIKVEEGLAKQVDGERITAAAEARLECLRTAKNIISAVSSEHGGGGPPRLITHTCFALESGLPEEVLLEIFRQHNGLRYGRLIHVLEAGETLQLAGLAPQHTKQIMMNCLDRDLNRMEIRRAVDYILTEHRKGRDFETIHAALWLSAD